MSGYWDQPPRYKQLSEGTPVDGVVECQHVYHVVTANVTVRYCEKCGVAWVLDGSYGWHWNDVREPNQVEQEKEFES